MIQDSARHLRVWLVHAGESLPIDPNQERQLRMSQLAATLAARGHRVTWWTSAFDHSYKRHRYQAFTRVSITDSYELCLLKGMGYRRAVSLARLIDHQQIARDFARRAVAEPAPDLVVCCIPTLELAGAAVAYARERGIPCVVDIRDLWPDVLLDVVPRPFRFLARLALEPLFSTARRALRRAQGLTAVSPSYLEWGLTRANRKATSWDRVFPHGYPDLQPDPRTASTARDRLRVAGVDPHKRIVCFIGMLGRWYDLSTVVEAARLLEARGRGDVQFVIAGDGDNAARWRREAQGVRSVIFTGWVTGPEIAALMSASSVALAAYGPGAPQSLPNKIFEYMQGGLPMLSSLGGDTEALLRQHGCGLPYRAGDSAHLAALLERLVDHEDERFAMGARARRAFETHFSAEAVYRGMSEYLEGLASSTQRP